MTTNEDKSLGNDDFISHDGTGKHLLFKVPSYEDSGSDLYQAKKDTFLNLGRGMGDALLTLPAWYAAVDDDGVPQWSAEGLAGEAVAAPSTSGDDLIAFFGGFVDDQRLRGAGGTFEQPAGTPPNESAPRTASAHSAVGATAAPTGTGRNLQVTQTIPDYVGWRDHTDGHRITTTRGDKIEIIGGNYKIVSLGRGTGVASYEMSGGIILDGDEAPGTVSSVTWRPCPTGTTGEHGWKAVEQVVQGNVVERYHGTKREEFYGDKLISVTGSPDQNTTGLGMGAGKSGDPETFVGDAAATAQNAVLKNVSLKGDMRSYAYPTKWDDEGGLPPKLQQPDIYESTWASSVNSYTHVNGKNAEDLYVGGDHVLDTFYNASYEAKVTLRGAGEKYIERWNTEGSMGFYEYFQGAMTQFFFGASTTIGLANRSEIFIGLEEQMNIGGFMELRIGKSTEVMAGQAAEFKTASYKFWLAENEAGVRVGTAAVSSMKATMTEAKTGMTSVGNSMVTVKNALVARFS